MAGAPASRLADARAGRGRRRAGARRAGSGRRHRPQPTIPFHAWTHLLLAPTHHFARCWLAVGRETRIAAPRARRPAVSGAPIHNFTLVSVAVLVGASRAIGVPQAAAE